MCGIAGIVQSDTKETANKLFEMLLAMKHRGPDGAGLAVGNEVRRARSLEGLKIDGLEGAAAFGHVRLAIVGGSEKGMQPFASSDGRLVMLHNGEIYNHHELRAKLSSDFETTTDSEVILRLLEEEYEDDLGAALERVLRQLDGVYAIVVSDGESLLIARDPIGVRQLYLGKGGGFFAFASERKALYALGVGDTERLEPGHLATIDTRGWRQKSFHNLELRDIAHDLARPERALEAYRAALEGAIFKRVRDRDRAGVIFSGGIDSVLIAYMLQRQKLPFTCYTAGVEGSPDLEVATAVARRLGFPLEFRVLSSEAIEALLPEIMAVVEDRSLNQVEVAVPVFASVRLASAAGERVLFTGQGADEVFGGYSWYPRIVEKEGYDSFLQYSIGDIEHLYKETLEREDKITMAHSIELRVPYLDPEVVTAGMRMDPRLKIRDGRDRLGKRIHRDLAEALGVPREFAFRRKEAAQHGAGIHEVIRSLAERRGFTSDLARACGYDVRKSVREVLGSSSRYGHRYGESELWEVEEEVQFYLDFVASKAGLLTDADERAVSRALRRATATLPNSPAACG